MSDKKQTYNVLSSLRHDGKAYGPDVDDGKTVKLSDTEAAPLVKLNVVEARDTAAPTPEPVVAPANPDDRLAVILAALKKGVVKTIKPSAEEFTRAGRAALEKELGWAPGDADLDIAIAAFEEQNQ